jgi:hypothetical protein
MTANSFPSIVQANKNKVVQDKRNNRIIACLYFTKGIEYSQKPKLSSAIVLGNDDANG